MTGSIALINGDMDPEFSGLAEPDDLLIRNGKIAYIGKLSEKAKGLVKKNGTLIDCTGKLVCPGLIDVHVHGRTPGQTHKETLGSLGLAAIAGGFTTVVCMANTEPPIHNEAFLHAVLLEMEQHDSFVDMFQVAAATKQRKGQELTDFQALAENGAIAFSDDGDGIQDPVVLHQAMASAALCNRPIFLHCQDTRFAPDDERAEIHDVSLALRIAEAHDLPVHLQHISCEASVALIREAKERGVRVTCETAPHYFSLTYQDLQKIGANAKMNPPLKTERDRQEVIVGLRDGTIDIIATDHAPHTPAEKAAEKEKDRPYGVIGLETAVPVSFTSLQNNLPAEAIIKKMTLSPAKLLGLAEKGRLKVGLPADVVVIDPKKTQYVRAETFQSKGRNCPWDGKRLKGWPLMTIKNGRIVMQDGKIMI